MKDLKYEHQSTFALRGGSNLILGTSREKTFFLTTPAAINFFHQILKNCHSGVKKKSLPTQMHLYSPYMFHYTLP